MVKKYVVRLSSEERTDNAVAGLSHNMESIMGLCSRTIWLDGGIKKAEGPSEKVVREYLDATREKVKKTKLADRTDRKGNGRIRFIEFHLEDEKGNLVESVVSGDTVCFVFSYVAEQEPVYNATMWFWIFDGYNRRLINFWSRHVRDDFECLDSKGKIKCRVPRFPLVPGSYSVGYCSIQSNNTRFC